MRVRVAHISLQFTDSDAQHKSDIEKLFARAQRRKYAWITGTEAGPSAGNTGRLLIDTGKEHGYRLWVPEVQGDGIARHTDSWIAVRNNLIDGKWNADYQQVIPGSQQLKNEMHIPDDKRWGPKGLVTVGFESTNKDLGDVGICATHYLTEARSPRSPYWHLNKKLGKEIGDWAKREGKGPALVFYGGDQNMADNQNDQPQGDTFFGEDLTSVWDELRKWENTGHGNIDVIATANRDKRVKALNVNVLNDREFHLHTDHFLVEATFEVEPLKRR